MILAEFVSLLQEDLKNEWAHLRFYAHYSQLFTGLQAEYYSKMFQEHASGELAHVLEFAELIANFGSVPGHDFADTPLLHDKVPMPLIMEMAAQLETTVAENYATRLEQLEALEIVEQPGVQPSATKVDKKYLQLFYEKQLEDSRRDALTFKRLAAVYA